MNRIVLALLVLPTAFWTCWCLSNAYSLLRNYLRARKIGLPLVLIPISPENPIWMLVDKKLFVPLVERLPWGLGQNSFTRYNWRGWEFRDKNRSHLEMGDAFIIVSPGRNALYISNTDALLDVFKRRSEFTRPVEMLEMLNVFGQNISTVDGQPWQRQRKATASCFNEDNNDIVWNESIRQAQSMLHYWASKATVSSIADDVRSLSLNVLSSAGFGQSYPFPTSKGTIEDSAASTYRSSLQTILDNSILLMILGRRSLAKSWLPKKLKTLHQATVTFEKHMAQAYEKEKKSAAEKDPGRKNLLTTLVRESFASGEAGLTESEIYGNMFVFNFAGHDTTAHTLAFAVALLSANPEVQSWLAEEIHHVFGVDSDPDTWNYQASFPKLKRCLAVLLETLRLYPEVPPVKCTGEAPRTITLNNKEFVIPANTIVLPSQLAVHTHPQYWGHEDPLCWRPGRWIIVNPDTASETLVSPPKGAFFPWSEGARSCPGKKFSQAEFVATMATLFHHAKVEPTLEPGETKLQARQRIAKSIENDTGMVLLLQLLHPENIRVTWKHC